MVYGYARVSIQMQAQVPINPKTGKQHSLKTGRDIGRSAAEYPHNWKEVYAEWKAKKITAVEAMKRAGLKKNTFYNLVKRHGGQYRQGNRRKGAQCGIAFYFALIPVLIALWHSHALCD